MDEGSSLVDHFTAPQFSSAFAALLKEAAVAEDFSKLRSYLEVHYDVSLFELSPLQSAAQRRVLGDNHHSLASDTANRAHFPPSVVHLLQALPFLTLLHHSLYISTSAAATPRKARTKAVASRVEVTSALLLSHGTVGNILHQQIAKFSPEERESSIGCIRSSYSFFSYS